MISEIYSEKRIYCKEKTWARNCGCPKILRPVCAWFFNYIECFRPPCAYTASNDCTACCDNKIDYYTEGRCHN